MSGRECRAALGTSLKLPRLRFRAAGADKTGNYVTAGGVVSGTRAPEARPRGRAGVRGLQPIRSWDREPVLRANRGTDGPQNPTNSGAAVKPARNLRIRAPRTAALGAWLLRGRPPFPPRCRLAWPGRTGPDSPLSGLGVREGGTADQKPGLTTSPSRGRAT